MRNQCEVCRETVTEGVRRFSLDHQKGHVFCQTHQKNPRELRELDYVTDEDFMFNGVMAIRPYTKESRAKMQANWDRPTNYGDRAEDIDSNTNKEDYFYKKNNI